MTTSDREIAEALAKGRLSGEKMTGYPGPMPRDKAHAFAIQTEAAKIIGWTRAGWKVGCTSEMAQKHLGTDGPFPGPVYRERLFRSGDHVPTHASNSRTSEPEIAFTFGKDLPKRDRPYSIDEVLAAVATVHPALEVVNPRLPKQFDDHVFWYIADGALSDALVIGPGVKPLKREDYATRKGEARVNGEVVSTGVGANALKGPENVLTWLANDLTDKGFHLRVGDVVTTGVITGLFFAKLGDEVKVSIESIGDVIVRY
ncbi:MAG: 2-keto-4-pentenoate hydratase [Parvibaculaceae bacterium]